MGTILSSNSVGIQMISTSFRFFKCWMPTGIVLSLKRRFKHKYSKEFSAPLSTRMEFRLSKWSRCSFFSLWNPPHWKCKVSPSKPKHKWRINNLGISFSDCNSSLAKPVRLKLNFTRFWSWGIQFGNPFNLMPRKSFLSLDKGNVQINHFAQRITCFNM